MKQFLAAIVVMYLIIVSMSTVADSTADTDYLPLPSQEEMNEMFGAPPDKSVKSWVRLDILGASSRPFPIIWVSPQNFKRIYPNYLVKLEREEYKQFKKAVRINQCSVRLDKNSIENTLRVTEYFNGHKKDRCIMPRKSTCSYLTNILALPSITWSEEKMEGFKHLKNEYGCK
jgi:hypothetical protein